MNFPAAPRIRVPAFVVLAVKFAGVLAFFYCFGGFLLLGGR